MKVKTIARAISRPIYRPVDRPGSQLGPVLGPEMAPSLTDGAWTSGLAGFTQDGSGLHLSGSNGGAVVHTLDTEDNVTYQITYTVSLTSGSVFWQLYGDTSAHLGKTTEMFASGTYTEQVTTNTAGSLNNTLRVVAGGGAGANTFNITALSIKKVLG